MVSDTRDALLATLLLLPVLLNATVIHLDILQAQPLADDSSFEIIAKEQHQTVTKCMFDGTNSFFIFYTFGCGFVLPALLITYFYTRVIFRLQKSVANIRRNSVSSKNSGSTSRVQQVTKRIVAVILFYFFCWTPQWILNLLSHFSLITVSWSTLTLSSIFFAAHLLVCFNSATNPILYALINRELRQQHVQAMLKRRRSISNATNHALDFIAKHSHSGLNPFYNDAQQRQQQQQQPQQTLRASNHSLIALVGFKKTPALRRQRSSSCDSLKSAQAKSAVLAKRASTSSTITENSPSAIRHKSTNALSAAQQYFKDDLSKPQQSDTTIQINCVINTEINITLAVPSNLITENLNANKTPAAIASYRSRKQKQLPSSSLLGDQNIAAELLSYDDHIDVSNKHYPYERSSNVQRRSSASENVMLLKYECFHSNDESSSIEELHSNKLRNADSTMKEDCLMRSTAVPIKFEPNDALL
ncbi:unnamed protein product [Anisakis simplex]|uniref:G_PROTEIN_RECEP_F1_2 domain-containing protein n=1 Tax=Anisakis simplex TaxID=6269 RepID=A0A0M3JZR8_ANISI|nr:unnamed protein product [Anisakis simplex]